MGWRVGGACGRRGRESVVDVTDEGTSSDYCSENKHRGPFERLGNPFGLLCTACNMKLCGKTWQPFGLDEGQCLLPLDHDEGHEPGTHPRSVTIR